MAARIVLSSCLILLLVAVAFAQDDQSGVGDTPSDTSVNGLDSTNLDTSASASDPLVDIAISDDEAQPVDAPADADADADAPLSPVLDASPPSIQEDPLQLTFATPTPTPTMAFFDPTTLPTAAIPTSTTVPTQTTIGEAQAAITPSVTQTPTTTVRATATATPSPSRTHTLTPTPGPFNFLSGAGVPLGLPTSAIPSGQTPISGLWTGTTSQGKTISFTVDGSNIRTMTFEWTTTGCSATDALTNDSYPPGGPQITSNTLMIMGGPPNGLQGIVYVSGTFNTASAAAGSGSVALFGTGDPPCGSNTQFSWSASPAGHP